MATVNVAVGIRFRWWLMPYLRLMVHLAYCGVRIDGDKLVARVNRGIVIETKTA